MSLPSSVKTVGHERLLSAPAAAKAAAPSGDLDARIKEAERRLAVSKAWDGAENMSTAYGDYLDDLDYGQLGKLFALKGHKEVPFSGFYVGRQRIIERDATSPAPGSRPRAMLPLHWRTQPVILVASDGRSASIRSRLFQPASSNARAMGFGGGMYHDQVVLEDGVWRFWSVVIDEHYFSSPPTYEGGWSSAKDPVPAAARPPAAQANNYPPDIPLTTLGERERGFRGGTGDMIVWPGILPMWFHDKNPVSGRVPEHYWPDCVPCTQYPEQHEEPRIPVAAVLNGRRVHQVVPQPFKRGSCGTLPAVLRVRRGLRAGVISAWLLLLKARRRLNTQLVSIRKTARTRLKRPRKIIRDWSGDARRGFRRKARIVTRILQPVTSAASGVRSAGHRMVQTVLYQVPGEARVCPACRSERLRILDVLPLLRNIDGRRYGFVGGCEDCGLAFANPVHDAAEIDSLYEGDGDWAAPRSNTEAPGDPSSANMARLFGAMANDLNVLSPPADAAALDIGCGKGDLLNGLQRLGWKTYGIEPAIKIAFDRHIELTEIPAREQFRLILLRHVLEHLRDPLDMLRRAERALLPGGYVFISVPNLDALPSHGDFHYCISDRPHISAYTRTCLVTLLARAGLNSVPSGQAGERTPTSTVVFARKESTTVAPEPSPLDAAATVFGEYRRRHRASFFESWMPVRLRAGVLNERRLAAARR